jgi:hypothetical protein
VERAVVLDQATGGAPASFEELAETSAIAGRFHEVLDRLEERTRQLDNARKLAYLGEISTSIAHEVNNPLGVIVMNAGFLQKRLKNADRPGRDQGGGAVLHRGPARPWWSRSSRSSRATDAARRGPAAPPGSTRWCARPSTSEDRIRTCGIPAHRVAENVLAISCEEQGVQQVIFNLPTNARRRDRRDIVRLSVRDGALLLRGRRAGMLPRSWRVRPSPSSPPRSKAAASAWRSRAPSSRRTRGAWTS